jgi:hypothetical protein
MKCDKCKSRTFLRIDGLCPRCHVAKEDEIMQRAELVRLGGGGGVLVGRYARATEKGHNVRMSDGL